MVGEVGVVGRAGVFDETWRGEGVGGKQTKIKNECKDLSRDDVGRLYPDTHRHAQTRAHLKNNIIQTKCVRETIV